MQWIIDASDISCKICFDKQRRIAEVLLNFATKNTRSFVESVNRQLVGNCLICTSTSLQPSFSDSFSHVVPQVIRVGENSAGISVRGDYRNESDRYMEIASLSAFLFSNNNTNRK